jgi:hypothetical protein
VMCDRLSVRPLPLIDNGVVKLDREQENLDPLTCHRSAIDNRASHSSSCIYQNNSTINWPNGQIWLI